MDELMIEVRSRHEFGLPEHYVKFCACLTDYANNRKEDIDLRMDFNEFLMAQWKMSIVNDYLKKHRLCDVEEEAIDAVGAIKRVTRDSVPVASSTRNESIWYKLFRKPFKKNIKNET